ncbi:MAG: aminotransferase class IV [Polyangiales bacterium]
MPEVVMIDGGLIEPTLATISLRDRSVGHGDSVFEVVRAYRGRPFALEEHLGRLQRSAQLVGRVFPCSVGRLAAEVTTSLRESALDDAHIRILLTRGEGRDGLLLDGVRGGRRVVWVRPLPDLSSTLYERGVRACRVFDDVRGLAAQLRRAKTGNYLDRVVALDRARGQGFDEVLLTDSDDCVWEASAANVFALWGRTLVTPPESGPILAGVTRAKLLDLAREGSMAVEERKLQWTELLTADEVFISSTIREVVSVVEIDDHVVGTGTPGRVAGLLRAALRSLAGAA